MSNRHVHCSTHDLTSCFLPGTHVLLQPYCWLWLGLHLNHSAIFAARSFCTCHPESFQAFISTASVMQ
jgi:hypothetical protein